MRIPLKWLREYCDPDGLDAAAIADRLDLTGTELERIEHVGVGDPAGFVVGKVRSAEPHPNADRLRVCEVDDGESVRTIVCGAPNVAAGQTVAVALPGAVLPDGATLGEAKLRGVRSSGMILAEDEVGIGDDHDGIMVLDDAIAAGMPLADVLPIADDVLELEITPNRPDCLSVYGIARELHAATAAPLATDPTDADTPPAGDVCADHVSIEIADPDICLRFTGRVYENVTVAPSPVWLRARLIAAGQRPISNVVDITNYVMLTCGQPLHAFDLDRVRGGRVIVRRAEPGERIVTLDGVERTLTGEMAVVADAEGASGIAGIMGGQVSEVSDSTTRVLIEAASWVPTNVLRTSKQLNLRSEASTRFEKGIHPAAAAAAQRLAARLMVELCGARPVAEPLDAYPEPLDARVVTLRLDRVTRLLGAEIPPAEVAARLESLGFGVESHGDELAVTVPYWRDGDVQREADLIEEVARTHGLDKLPITLPARRGAIGRLTPSQRLRRRLEDALRDRGFDEVVAWSFTSPQTLDDLRIADRPALALANPMSTEQSVLRPLLLPGLLDAARTNAARGGDAVALFESQHVYRPGPAALTGATDPGGALPAEEHRHLAALATEAAAGSWRRPPVVADFYAVKGLVEAVGRIASVELSFAAAAEPFLHPGRAALVAAGDQRLGWVGELHPTVAQRWDLPGAAAFELDFDALAALAPGPAAFAELAAHPSVRQDIAVVVPRELPAADVRAAIRTAGGDLLAAADVFDVYEGDQVGEGNRSLALALEFRAGDHTLTDAEVAVPRAAIEAAVAALGGRLRG